MRMEKKNCSTVRPMPAVAESSFGRKVLICGVRSFTASVKLCEAMLQIRFKGAPMSDVHASSYDGMLERTADGGVIRFERHLPLCPVTGYRTECFDREDRWNHP